MGEDAIGREVVDAAVGVDQALGPGLLGSVYEVALAYELRERGLHVERQVSVPFRYKETQFDEGFRIDLLVESRVVVEVKSVEALNNAHRKQVLTCLRVSNRKLGFLLNFGQALMKQGVIRIVNGLNTSQ